MRDNTRAGRNAVYLGPEALRLFENERSAWFESEEDVEAGLEWGRQKALLLRWVRRQMDQHLTDRERRCAELYFFEGHTYREIGRITGTNASSAYRAVVRSLRKLKRRVIEDDAALGALNAVDAFKQRNPEARDPAPGQTE